MKVLVLENGSINEDDFISNVIKWYKDDEVTIIEQSRLQDREFLVKSIMTTDIVVFATTWLYADQIRPFGKLLALSQKPLDIQCYNMGSRAITYELEDIFKLEELSEISHHLFSEIVHKPKEGREWLNPIDLTNYKVQFEKEEKERVEKNKSFRKTGFKIKIKTIGAVGKQWSKLEPDMIVDELDCKEIDPKPEKGTWVMGLDEPVKLLNSEGFDEFEYAEDKCWALAYDFASRGHIKNDSGIVKLLAQVFNKGVGKNFMTESQLWDHCTELCDQLLQIPRRKNRDYMYERLLKYREQYVYFCELSTTSFR